MSYFTRGRMHIMPVDFGPGGTPRETEDCSRFIYVQPTGTKVTSHKVAYETDAKFLEGLLPDSRFKLLDPCVILSFNQLRDIAWLGGNGYDLIQIEIPVFFDGSNEKIKGTFMPVVWENHADPILTGREQLGWNKIYADMETPIEKEGSIKGSASSWGFKFLEIRLDLNVDAPFADEFNGLIKNPENMGMMHHKYIPKTGGEFDQADVDYITLSPAKWLAPDDYDETKVIASKTRLCYGEIEWFRPEWKQMPTQAHIIKILHDMKIKRFLGACKTELHAVNDRKDQVIVE